MQNFLKASTLGFLLIASQSFADDTLSSLQTDLTDFANSRSAEAYTLTTSSSNGDTAIIFRIQDGNTIDSKTYYFTPSDDERAILTRLASSGNIFLKEALEGENVLFDINGVGYTIDLDAVSRLSLNMANITETTSPTDTSIIINDKYYNINPRSYDNAQNINPTSYEAGKIATKYFQWDTENNHLVLNETGETSDNDLDIRIYGLVLDKKYGQWNFVGTIITPLSSEEIKHAHSLRDDTYEENEMEFVSFVNGNGEITMSQIKQHLRLYISEGMWDMALSAIYASLRCVGFTETQIHDMTKELL